MKRTAALVACLSIIPAVAFSEPSTPYPANPDPGVERLSPKPSGRDRFDELIALHAAQNDIPLELAHAVVEVESSYNPQSRGSAGEIGLMQIKLGTARDLGYAGSREALYEPAINIRYGMLYLGRAKELAGGDLCRTIMKYNGGHYATRMRASTKAYCSKVKTIIARNDGTGES